VPDLLHLKTPDFELSIWCNDISKRLETYQSTLEKRKALLNSQQETQHHIMRFSPPLVIEDVVEIGPPNLERTQANAVTQAALAWPVFFENLQYQFEWTFTTPKDGVVNNAQLTHRSHLLNENFRFVPASTSTPARLTGTINTANHVGWMRLPLEYVKFGQTYRSSIAFEVLPTKMSLHDDLPAMYHAIDAVYPLWRFSLVEFTEQDAGHNRRTQHFPLLWLANFNHLRSQLELGLKVINQAPHSRLQSQTSYNKASRLKGKLSHRIGAKIKEDFANGIHDKRYQITKKQLSVDTPENRFIKMVLTTCVKRLANFEYKLRHSNDLRGNQRVSNAFLDELRAWQNPLQKTLKQSFMQDVGPYQGRHHESLVLQQKAGYSAVYRIWQELKFYLDVFNSQASVSMKSVADIYEIWCFLTLRNILIDDLGFKEVNAQKSSLIFNDFYEYRLEDGFIGAFKFKREDGVTARLAHEPIFRKNGDEIRSYLVTQKPDILLEITLPKPSNKRFILLFDAKYRIKTRKTDDDDTDIETTDWVPDDAINQMHRYRDALIRLGKTKDQKSSTAHKSRPIFGAFALYPGYFNQLNGDNPYQHAISEVGIGAFALLPSAIDSEQKSTSGHHWLLGFLKAQIGSKQSTNYRNSSPAVGNQVNSPAATYQTGKQTYTSDEQLYLQDAARIPFAGMSQVLYPDLTMTISLGDKDERDSQYFDMFKKGLSQWYHLPVKTFNDKYKQHIASELRYLALAMSFEDQPDCKQISMVWPIKEVLVKKRFDINFEQTGKSSDSEDDYYLFELGKPLTLLDPITGISHDSFTATIKLTTLSLLQETSSFNDLQQVYQEGLKSPRLSIS
jgi:hypothetical protein